MNYITHYESPIGPITLASDGESLTALLFNGETFFDRLFDGQWDSLEIPAEDVRGFPAFAETFRWLDIYFSGDVPDFLPPLSLALATPFGREVCEIMMTIPYGETATYGQIADMIAKRRGIARMSAQAVGGAVGRNPISIIIPCHRIIGSDGSLIGYGGGLDKKRKLLALER